MRSQIQHNADSSDSAFLFSHQRLVHLIKSISIQMNIDVVRDVHIGMSEQSGKDLHVDSFVIAVRRKSVSEHMLSSVRNVSGFAQTPCLPSESLVREPLPIVTHENPFVFRVSRQHFQERNSFRRQWDCSVA